MSQHFVRHSFPPPGISSFTKIRLGWISRHQVDFVMPGDTRIISLSPLSRKGDTLAVKVPLPGGRYYLVENRQPVGCDRSLPDSGILILKVDPKVQEGSGTVRTMDADPDFQHFSRAAFRLDRMQNNSFVDKEHHVAVIPLWSEEENLNVLVTTPERSTHALQSALLVQKVLDFYPGPRSEEQDQRIKKCVGAFKNYDFKGCSRIAEAILMKNKNTP